MLNYIDANLKLTKSSNKEATVLTAVVDVAIVSAEAVSVVTAVLSTRPVIVISMQLQCICFAVSINLTRTKVPVDSPSLQFNKLIQCTYSPSYKLTSFSIFLPFNSSLCFVYIEFLHLSNDDSIFPIFFLISISFFSDIPNLLSLSIAL